MGPIPLRLPGPTVSSAHAPHGTHGTAKERKVGFGIRADSSDSSGNSGLASPGLIVALVVVGLLSLTMFSMFGRRVLEASRRQRRAAPGVDTASVTSERGEDHYVLLADMLGLDVSHIRQRVAQLPRLDDKPKMRDIQVYDRSLGAETHKEAPWYWGDIMVSHVSFPNCFIHPFSACWGPMTIARLFCGCREIDERLHFILILTFD